MILDGKAEIDFKYWLLSVRNEKIKISDIEYNLYDLYENSLPDSFKISLIVEWFQSLKVDVFYLMFEYYYDCRKMSKEKKDKIITDTILIAIKKSNKIYNNVYKSNNKTL